MINTIVKYLGLTRYLINLNSGSSGSGKTYSSMIILRQLFNVAGGGPETDAFKHLAAAFTVLRSLGSAKTTINSESSRLVSNYFSYTKKRYKN